jgi:hypothetical protein
LHTSVEERVEGNEKLNKIIKELDKFIESPPKNTIIRRKTTIMKKKAPVI